MRGDQNGWQSELGGMLRRWRAEAGLSRSDLAARAGVGKSTIRRWELGEVSPWIPELEAVLQALELPAAARDEALGLVNRTRQLRWRSARSDSLPNIGGNLLLRAIRLRARQNRARVAELVGVSEATVRQWERGEAWPSTANLHRFCQTLGATPEELLALSRGPLFPAVSLEDEVRKFEDFVRSGALVIGGIEEPLLDLQAIALEAGLVGQIRAEGPDPRWLTSLAFLRARYAQSLYLWGRDEEAEAVAARSCDDRLPLPADHVVHAGIIRCLARLRQRKDSAAELEGELQRLLGRLESAELPIRQTYRSWGSAMLADAYAAEQRADEALAAFDGLEAGGETPEGTRWRAKLLVNLRRPREAAEVAQRGIDLWSRTPGVNPILPGLSFELSRALSLRRHRDEAQAARTQALAWARHYGMGYLVRRITLS